MVSFRVDGELRSCQQTAATAFSRPRKGGLDMRRRLPGRLARLAASLRSMPTAVGKGSHALVRTEADTRLVEPYLEITSRI